MATSGRKSRDLGYQPKIVPSEQQGYRPQGGPVDPSQFKPPTGGTAIQPPPNQSSGKKSE